MKNLPKNTARNLLANRRSGFPFSGFPSELDSLFQSIFDESPVFEKESVFSGDWAPSLDFIESDGELKLNVEVPGVAPEDMHISISGDVLTITGEKKEEVSEEKKNYHRIERKFGSFTRKVQLPQAVDENSINADYKNGLLTITAKKQRQDKTKKIEIKS